MHAKLKDRSIANRPTIDTLPEVSASDLKNHFGDATRLALRSGGIAIKRRNRREFVLLSADEYAILQEARMAPLEALSREFDEMEARMNTPRAKKGFDALFKASPAELGKAAVKAARTHGG